MWNYMELFDTRSTNVNDQDINNNSKNVFN